MALTDRPTRIAQRPATEGEIAERLAAWEEWKLRFDAVKQLAAIEQDLMRLGYLTPSRAHYQRAAHRLPLPPCWTCGGPAIGRFPDGSALYQHYHPSGTKPYVTSTQKASENQR